MKIEGDKQLMEEINDIIGLFKAYEITEYTNQNIETLTTLIRSIKHIGLYASKIDVVLFDDIELERKYRSITDNIKFSSHLNSLKSKLIKHGIINIRDSNFYMKSKEMKLPLFNLDITIEYPDIKSIPDKTMKFKNALYINTLNITDEENLYFILKDTTNIEDYLLKYTPVDAIIDYRDYCSHNSTMPTTNIYIRHNNKFIMLASELNGTDEFSYRQEVSYQEFVAYKNRYIRAELHNLHFLTINPMMMVKTV